MAWFTKRATAAELDALKNQVRSMADRLNEADARREQDRKAAAELPPPDQSLSNGGEPVPQIPPAEFEELSRRLDDLAVRVETADARMTTISTELANQIDELGRERDTEPVDDAGVGEQISELRISQERLANEQARYQIAFREDLAKIADRLKT